MKDDSLYLRHILECIARISAQGHSTWYPVAAHRRFSQRSGP